MTPKPKTTFSLTSPYPETSWPAISRQDQDTILTLLHGLLEPVGKYRSQHVIASKGKRSKKKAKTIKVATEPKSDQEVNDSRKNLESKMQDILKHVTVGFNSTTRYLENIARKSALVKSRPPHEVGDDAESTSETGQERKPGPNLPSNTSFAAVFVPDSAQAAKIFAHLPVLIQASNLGVPNATTTRLILLPEVAESKLSSALNIPRVGIIGLMDGMEDAVDMIEMVRARVSPIELPWLEQAAGGIYLPVNIEQTTKVNPKREIQSGESHEDIS